MASLQAFSGFSAKKQKIPQVDKARCDAQAIGRLRLRSACVRCVKRIELAEAGGIVKRAHAARQE